MHTAVFHYPILFYSISVTNKGPNSNNIIDAIKFDSVLRAVINLHWFETLNGDFRYTNRIRLCNTHLCHVTIMRMSLITANQMQLQKESSHCCLEYLLFLNQF